MSLMEDVRVYMDGIFYGYYPSDQVWPIVLEWGQKAIKWINENPADHILYARETWDSSGNVEILWLYNDLAFTDAEFDIVVSLLNAEGSIHALHYDGPGQKETSATGHEEIIYVPSSRHTNKKSCQQCQTTDEKCWMRYQSDILEHGVVNWQCPQCGQSHIKRNINFSCQNCRFNYDDCISGNVHKRYGKGSHLTKKHHTKKRFKFK